MDFEVLLANAQTANVINLLWSSFLRIEHKNRLVEYGIFYRYIIYDMHL